ncbi:cAMP-specific 3',5'-cyclic phosphodiesterase (Partial), partial [Seminavis robusta]|eukprot:Sro4582_g354280.1 cAMP-specific 3',5'-cyclic phosphodiesterase (232) ;mRNA; r:2-1315
MSGTPCPLFICSSCRCRLANLRFSFGLTSDPITRFAALFASLIHDLDHPGVPNTTLVKENDPLATKYHGKSIAEQNSVELSWGILMKPEFGQLRACIYTNEDELTRFRSIVVNLVLATDIMDKDLGAQRKDRWARAFNSNEGPLPSQSSKENKETEVNRKATIVLEHLIQASDIAHTMQHWHVYRKWNERLFCEMYQAYKDGRSDKDPSEGWYEGEIGFFDFYIIPLAKKLE